jgi:cardiolipin synthase A/B
MDIVERLQQIAHHDWKNSHPLDLSDAGLLEDLQNRIEGSAETLVLNTETEKTKKKKNKKHHH